MSDRRAVPFHLRLAQILERGTFDALLAADADRFEPLAAPRRAGEGRRADHPPARPAVRPRRQDPDRHPGDTPESIADHIQEWFEGRGADGFSVIFPYLPGTLDDFATQVIPELRRRGLFRTGYTGRNLREHLGLPRPPSRRLGARG